MVTDVQDAIEKLRSLAEDKEEIKGGWCSFDFSTKSYVYL